MSIALYYSQCLQHAIFINTVYDITHSIKNQTRRNKTGFELFLNAYQGIFSK